MATKTSGLLIEIRVDEVNQFCEQQENESTKKKRPTTSKVLRNFLHYYNDGDREIKDIPQSELQSVIKKFVLAVRKKNVDE